MSSTTSCIAATSCTSHTEAPRTRLAALRSREVAPGTHGSRGAERSVAAGASGDRRSLASRAARDAPRVFGELFAGRGAQRFRDKVRLRDAEREVGMFESAIVRVWGQH